MLLSYSHNFIFIHNGKTGGSVTARLLEPFAHKPEEKLINRALSKIGINVNHLPPTEWKRFRRHATAASVRRHLPRAFFDGSFKFAFVRNPWDLLVSQYEHILSQPTHHRYARVARLDGFEDYLRFEKRRARLHQFKAVTDREGKIIVDFIGRFERIDHDLSVVGSKLGLVLELPARPTRPRDYKSYYTPKLIEFVAEHWRRDIELFGYSFDGFDDSALR